MIRTTDIIATQSREYIRTIHHLEVLARADESGALAQALKEASQKAKSDTEAAASPAPASSVDQVDPSQDGDSQFGDDWVNFTPELSVETQEVIAKAPYFPAYTLTMNSPLQAGDTTGWSEEQEILLTREEYVVLKGCLAAVRGIAAAKSDEDASLRIALPEARKMLIQASDREIQILAAALESMRADRGCHTPIEQFLRALLLENSRRDGLTPDFIEGEVETLHNDLALVKSIVRDYSTRHPWVKNLLLGAS